MLHETCSISRSVRDSAVPRKSNNRYGSLDACVARSESAGGSVRGKLVTAPPSRSYRRARICSSSVSSRLQPCSMALSAYQMRVSERSNLCNRASLLRQGICATVR